MTKRRGNSWFFVYLSILLPAVVAISRPCAAQDTKVTVTEYTYNADGELTSVTVTPDDEQPTTTYLVWDNFTPDAADPTTGTTAVANGRLVGFGPSPDNLTTTLPRPPVDTSTRAFRGTGQLRAPLLASRKLGRHPRRRTLE